MKEELESLLQKNALSIDKHYQKGEQISEAIIEEVLRSTLEESLLDTSRLTFVEYSKKYLTNCSYFEYKDFTSSEIKVIIGETPLTERYIQNKKTPPNIPHNWYRDFHTSQLIYIHQGGKPSSENI